MLWISRMLKAATIAGVSAGLALAMPAGAAQSVEAKAAAKTKVRMKMKCNDGTCQRERRALTSGSFSGKVRSSAAECVDGRQVKVIRKGVSPGPIGSVEASESGRWTLESDDLLPGTYFARAAKASEGGTKCKRGKSKKWTLEFNRREAPDRSAERFAKV